jgi:hypothetical protein
MERVDLDSGMNIAAFLAIKRQWTAHAEYVKDAVERLQERRPVSTAARSG